MEHIQTYMGLSVLSYLFHVTTENIYGGPHKPTLISFFPNQLVFRLLHGVISQLSLLCLVLSGDRVKHSLLKYH